MMKYRVKMKIGWRKQNFDFNSGDEALKFMEQAVRTVIKDPDDDDVDFTVDMEVIDDGAEEEEEAF